MVCKICFVGEKQELKIFEEVRRFLKKKFRNKLYGILKIKEEQQLSSKNNNFLDSLLTVKTRQK